MSSWRPVCPVQSRVGPSSSGSLDTTGDSSKLSVLSMALAATRSMLFSAWPMIELTLAS